MDRNALHPRLSYRAFIVNDQGRLSGVPQIIEADSDTDAACQAESLAGWQAVELWEGARLVARVPPAVRDLPRPSA